MADIGKFRAASHAVSRSTLPSRMFRTPALAPVKTPASSSSSVAIRSGSAIRRSVAIGSVRNRLVAVVSSTRIAGVAMPGHERARRAADARQDLRLHEAAAQRQPAGARAPRQRRRVEGAELGRRDRAGAIALDDAPVARFEVGAVQDSLVHQELAPELVGVAVEQRPVEIEQREPESAQGLRRCQAFGRMKVWMP